MRVASRSTTLPITQPSITQPRNILSRLIRSRAWKLSFVGILLAVIIGSLVLWRVWQQPEKPRKSQRRCLSNRSPPIHGITRWTLPQSLLMANTWPFVRKGNCLYRLSAPGRSVPFLFRKGFTQRESPGSLTERSYCSADPKNDGFK